MSYAEFVAFERDTARKHEYVNGRVYAMAGGSPEHARLAGAVAGELRAMLRGKPCAPFSSDLRIRIVATQRSTYPDVAVVCGALERASDDDDALTNPAVLVEVLSDSTEREDRGDKWAHYQRLASLREYVLVSHACAPYRGLQPRPRAAAVVALPRIRRRVAPAVAVTGSRAGPRRDLREPRWGKR